MVDTSCMDGVTASSMSPTLEFIEQYTDCLEVLPHDIQRCITQIRELDSINGAKLEQVGRFMALYKREQSGLKRKKWLNKMQRCLVRSHQCGDEKLVLVNQIGEMIEARTSQMARYAEKMELSGKDGVSNSSNGSGNGNGHGARAKIEKKVTACEERLQKVFYDKPRRMRRVRTLEKISETSEKNHKTIATGAKTPPSKDMEQEELPDTRKELVRKEKEKEKEKEKDVKEKDEKEERRPERRDVKVSKLMKKAASKGNAKLKKKKKKEKGTVAEEMVVDPDEPRYCLCNRVSFGDMIGCDNEDCSIEWFHFGCVNLTHKPKGKWYCPGCTSERKEKGKKT